MSAGMREARGAQVGTGPSPCSGDVRCLPRGERGFECQFAAATRHANAANARSSPLADAPSRMRQEGRGSASNVLPRRPQPYMLRAARQEKVSAR